MIHYALNNYLNAQISLGEFYGLQAPVSASFPCGTMSIESTIENRHYEAGLTVTGFTETDMEISCWGETQIQADSLAREVLSTLRNYKGPMTDLSSPQVVHTVADLQITSQSQGFESQVERFAHSVFITITHS